MTHIWVTFYKPDSGQHHTSDIPTKYSSQISNSYIHLRHTHTHIHTHTHTHTHTQALAHTHTYTQAAGHVVICHENSIHVPALYLDVTGSSCAPTDRKSVVS